MEIKPFYVGQEVVANCNLDCFKKGDEFRITSIMKGCCYWVVCVGIHNDNEYRQCLDCGHRTRKPSSERIFMASRFSPKVEISAFISMKEVVQLETIGAN